MCKKKKFIKETNYFQSFYCKFQKVKAKKKNRKKKKIYINRKKYIYLFFYIYKLPVGEGKMKKAVRWESG